MKRKKLLFINDNNQSEEDTHETYSVYRFRSCASDSYAL